MNIYFTTEPLSKLQYCILNVRSFYIFDVHEFIQTLDINPRKPANIYYINNEIVETLNAAARLKKYIGIIYVNTNLSEKLYDAMKIKFGNNEFIDKFILLDNGNVNKLKHLYHVFDEVIFFDRFKKIKIVEANPISNGTLIEFNNTDSSRYALDV